MTDQLYRYSLGVMTEKEFILKHAIRLEIGKVGMGVLYNRRKFNSLEGDAQKEYMAKLEKKAEKPEYRAYYSEDAWVCISKKTYNWAIKLEKFK
jgi:hypothetical protein